MREEGRVGAELAEWEADDKEEVCARAPIPLAPLAPPAAAAVLDVGGTTSTMSRQAISTMDWGEGQEGFQR